ncbi:protein FAM98A-like isoform X2 [Watersipora subatra]|uniref:protein FAM98A-like isoform X2 n=1 Tax=Watersipora subatra TaxID=2589382 RepID=UPI00355C4C87
MPATDQPTAESNSCFLMELSGFLREYGCPHRKLVEGPVDQRLQDSQSKLHLIDYLLSEFQAAQIYFTDKPQQVVRQRPYQQTTELSCSENLKQTLICLGFSKPPPSITPFDLFSKLEAKLRELITRFPSAVGTPLLKAQLTAAQWQKVLHYNSRLTQEYNLRQEMLRKRLDVTIQSFLWSDRAKAKEEEVMKSYQPLQRNLARVKQVSLSDLLAARDSLLNIEKTNLNRRGAETPINKVIMGNVPDRGGRTGNMQVPPPEMPSFTKRQADTGAQGQRPQSGRGDRYQGGSGGNRVQGGWSNTGKKSAGSKATGGGRKDQQNN